LAALTDYLLVELKVLQLEKQTAVCSVAKKVALTVETLVGLTVDVMAALSAVSSVVWMVALKVYVLVVHLAVWLVALMAVKKVAKLDSSALTRAVKSDLLVVTSAVLWVDYLVSTPVALMVAKMGFL
jgi:type IV secretory pathway TrbD component